MLVYSSATVDEQSEQNEQICDFALVHTAYRLTNHTLPIRCLCGDGLHDLMAQALTEAVEHAKDEGGGHQADQDHSQCELLNHEQIDAQGQRAEVEQAEEAHDKTWHGA